MDAGPQCGRDRRFGRHDRGPSREASTLWRCRTPLVVHLTATFSMSERRCATSLAPIARPPASARGVATMRRFVFLYDTPAAFAGGFEKQQPARVQTVC